MNSLGSGRQCTFTFAVFGVGQCIILCIGWHM
jgi:hypothetical protein